ncbi:molecular chaperone HscC [Legionella saoudiensis]|uniref:molecular chaperone HscC n=1 Tax=Legionella saoudiensis TaxID=1750561 RepID=UPI00073080D4|nr:molecular chaperone HscC [Legionella saoudiensis]
MIVGIDLGTTNSLIAFWDDTKAKLIPNVLGKFLTPSVISVDENSILVGEPALNRLVTHPALTMANFKRYMGTNKVFKLGNYSFRAEELSAFILKQLKEDAELFLGMSIHEAVISVPAYFSDAQRKATKIAGQLAGLHVERLINEPTAAGIAYGLQEKLDDTNYLIFDLGGGTFDVSLLNMFSGVIEVRASHGDNVLGGIDFTQVIEEMFLNDLIQAKGISKEQIPEKQRQKILEQAELAKHQLSLAAEATLSVNWDGEIFSYQYSELEFENKIAPLLERLRNPVIKVLNDAKLSSASIDQVVLVGGATRMKSVKKLVSRMFGKLPLCHLDQDTVIAQGAAIQAGLKSQNKALDEIVVTDVCPYSLGIEVCNNEKHYFDPIIERNMVIPISRAQVYYPYDYEQAREVEIKIYQGESLFVEKNVFLGSFTITVDKHLKNKGFEVRFTYDIDGLLEVEATFLETKEKKTLIIEGNPGVLSKQEIAERLLMLAEIKMHPREQIENQLIISRAEKLYEDLSGNERLALSQLIKEFIQVIDSQDPQLISRARSAIKIKLDEIQHNQFSF